MSDLVKKPCIVLSQSFSADCGFSSNLGGSEEYCHFSPQLQKLNGTLRALRNIYSSWLAADEQLLDNNKTGGSKEIDSFEKVCDRLAYLHPYRLSQTCILNLSAKAIDKR